MMRKIVFLLIPIILLLPVLQGNAMDNDESVKKIDSYLKEQFKQAGAAGGAYAIINKDKIIAANGIGFSSLETKTKAGPKTVYSTASVTKVFTAAAILKLQEQGKLDIHDRVQTYLPWFSYKDRSKSEKVTIENLLTHSSGVNRYQADGSVFNNEQKNRNSLENSIRALRTVEMDADPGERGDYCNTCYNTLGLIIEKASGMSYYDYLNQVIFQPLEMNHTVFGKDLNSLSEAEKAEEYSWLFGFRFSRLTNYQFFGQSQDPEGGIYSNTLEMAHFASAMMGYGESPILSSELLKQSYQGKVNTEEGTSQYTLGGFIRVKLDEYEVLFKDGDGIGSTSAMLLLPEKGYGVILNVGESHTGIAYSITTDMMRILLGKEPLKKKPAANYFRTVGYAALAVTIVSAGFIAVLVRIFFKNKHRKRRFHWRHGAVGIILFSADCGIGYLLFAARPSQGGFYGLPYDVAFSLIVLWITIFLWFIYLALLSMNGFRKLRPKAPKNPQSA